MSVGSYGGKICKPEEVYTTPSMVVSAMGQVMEATDVDYTDGGSTTLLDEANELLNNLIELKALTQTAIQDKNTLKTNYEDALALYTAVNLQYQALITQYNNALITFGTPFQRSIVQVIGYENGTLSQVNLGNSSIGQFGDTSQGYTNPVILGTGTLSAGSYTAYVNLSLCGINATPTGERTNQNTMAFSVTDTNYIVIGGSNLNSSNFCEYNVTTDEGAQGVLVSMSGYTTFTLTATTAVQYRVMIMREQNYLNNTPNFVAPSSYSRTAYSGGGTMTIDLNQRAITIVRMN